MEPFHVLARPRPDVASGETDASVYAASLGDMLRHPESGRSYWDSDQFDKLTYRTNGLKAALEDIRVRLQDGRGNGFRQIETSFGGGKTHSMIAMYHECRRWGARPIVIDGGNLDASRETVWGEMHRQLGGASRGMVAPSEGDIIDMLAGGPTLILMDEILPYLESAAGVRVVDTNLAVQTNTFMQRLSNAVKSLPHVCVVLSLPDRTNVQEKALYDHLKSVAGRQRQLVTVATENDMPHILRRRLFSTDEAEIGRKAARHVSEYTKRCVEGRSIGPDDAKAYAAEFTRTYPFTPDLLDVLFRRWATYPRFQKTRGALRLLSQIVHSLLGSNRTEITVGDIDLSVQTIRKELVKHSGENTEVIIDADITGESAGVRPYGEVGMRCARAIFLYSFPRECKGATHAEMKRAVSTGEISHPEVGDTLGHFAKALFYLDLTDDDMYRFDITENINRVIERAVGNVDPADIDAEELRWLNAECRPDGNTGFSKVSIWPAEQTRIADTPELQLIILGKSDPERCAWLVRNVGRKLGRANSNSLVFLLPTVGGKLTENIRRLLAMARIRETHGEALKGNAVYMGRVSEEESTARNYIPRGLREKYTDIFLPSPGGVRRFETMMVDTANDGTPLPRIVWRKLVRENEIHETFTGDMLSVEYGGDPEEAYRRMTTTPGERRPASLEVLRNATVASQTEPEPVVESAEVKPVKPTGTTGNTPAGFVGVEPSIPEGKPEPEPEPGFSGVRCSCIVGPDDLGGLGTLLPTVRGKNVTSLRFHVDGRADGRFDVVFDVDGDLDGALVERMRDLFPGDAVWEALNDWDD